MADGTAHDVVAQRMVECLTGHDLLASAPSWDGKWLGTLLRAAGLPRHSLRLRNSDDAYRERAEGVLAASVPSGRLAETVAACSPGSTSSNPIGRPRIVLSPTLKPNTRVG